MKIVLAPPETEPSLILECSKGHRFWVCPHTEENLEFNGLSLKAVCPECGEREEDEKAN